MELLVHYHVPELIERLDSFEVFGKIMSYNQSLTNGGFAFEEFALIKMLHIGLKMVREDQHDLDLWKSFEKCIRKRLHRCTME